MAKSDKKPAPESSGAAADAKPAAGPADQAAPIPRGEIVPTREAFAMIRPPTMVTPVHQFPTSLDLRDAVQKVLFFRALGRPEFLVRELNGAPFKLQHYVVHPDESVDEESGEVQRFVRVKLIDPDGRILETTGIGIIARLEALLTLWPGLIGGQGIDVRVVEKRSRRQGQTYHDLEVVLPK